MTRIARPCTLLALLSLVFTTLAPMAARATDDTPTLEVPAPPPPAAEQRRRDLLGALAPELHGPVLATASDIERRVRAALDAGEPVDVRRTAGAALLEADFADLSRPAALDAVIDIVVLQLSGDLHVELRDRIGRQLAIRAVRACDSSSACLDAIWPTADMPADHIARVRAELGDDAEALAEAELQGEYETGQAQSVARSFFQALADVMASSAATAATILRNVR
jgi:hypothetical protein